MSGFDIFEDPVPVPSPSPAVAPVPVPATSPRPVNWFQWALIALVCVLLYSQFRGCPSVVPNVDPDDKSVDGLHVLILEKTEDRSELPQGQLAIFTSSELREWYAKNCATEANDNPAYRLLDTEDDLSKDYEVWQFLREKVSMDPPCVLLADGNRGEQFKLPKDPEAMLAALKKFKGRSK